MRIFLLITISILVVSWQLAWLPRLSIFTVTANLILAGVLAFALCQKEEKKYWWILIPVLIFDLLVGRPFGLFSLSLCLAFFSAEFLADVLFKKNDLLAILLLVVIGILSFEAYYFLLAEIFSFWHLVEPVKLSAFYFSVVLPVKILYNGSLTLLGLLIIKKSRPLFYHGQTLKIK